MHRVRSLMSLSGVFIVLAACGSESVSPEDGSLTVSFLTQPGGASGGTPFTIQPVVEVLDARGNRALGTPTVTVELRSNPGGGSLSGTAAVTAADGLASFTDLRIDKAGTGYMLTAKSGGSTAASQPFDVAVGPPNPDSSLVTTGTGPLMAGDAMLIT